MPLGNTHHSDMLYPLLLLLGPASQCLSATRITPTHHNGSEEGRGRMSQCLSATRITPTENG